jgi:hypothetical protein
MGLQPHSTIAANPFNRPTALAMLQHEAVWENLPVSDNVLEHPCNRTGWLSPFFLNLLFDETRRVAAERITEERAADHSILRGTPPRDGELNQERVGFNSPPVEGCHEGAGW